MAEKFVIQFLLLFVIFKVSDNRLIRDAKSEDDFNSTKFVQNLRNPWIDPASILSKPGRDDFIQCSVTSNAPVSFEWIKDGNIINETVSSLSIGSIKIVDLNPISRDKRSPLKIYKSVLRFKPLTMNSNGSYSCLVHGPGYEKTETVTCSVFVSDSFDGYHHEMTPERKFLAGAIFFIFSMLFIGTILVTFLSFKL